MIQSIVFVLGFVCGPLIFWVLASQTPSRRYVTALWIVSALLVASAYALRQWGTDLGPYSPVYPALLLWLAWVAVLSLILLAIRKRTLPSRNKRLAYGIIAAATTLPWFGLYTAQMVAVR